MHSPSPVAIDTPNVSPIDPTLDATQHAVKKMMIDSIYQVLKSATPDHPCDITAKVAAAELVDQAVDAMSNPQQVIRQTLRRHGFFHRSRVNDVWTAIIHSR
jgi:hypothetical protein